MALAIALGLLLGGAIVVSPIGNVVGLLYRFWYVGAATVVLAAVLGSRGISQAASRMIGFAGVVWIAILAAMPLLTFVALLVAGPRGL